MSSNQHAVLLLGPRSYLHKTNQKDATFEAGIAPALSCCAWKGCPVSIHSRISNPKLATTCYNRILNPAALQHCSKLSKNVRNLARKQCALCFDFQQFIIGITGFTILQKMWLVSKPKRPWLPSLLHPSPNPQFLLLLVGLVVESAAPSIEYSTSERLQVQTAPDLGPRVAWILWTSCGISALGLDISVSILYAVYIYNNDTMCIYIYILYK